MRRLGPFFFVAVLAAAAVPMFIQPQAVPVERLTANLAKFIEDKPDDPQLLYNMARLHYLALANESALVPAFEREGQPPTPAATHQAGYFLFSLRWNEANDRARKALGIDESTRIDRELLQKLDDVRSQKSDELEAEGWRPPAPDMEVMHEHAEQAIVHFDKAIALAPNMALYQLGRASLGEQCLDFELAGKLPRRRVIEPLAELTYAEVRDWYYDTFRLALDPELEVGHLPLEGLTGLVSHEAGLAYLRMVEKSDELREGQDERIAKVRDGVEQVKKLPMRMITPILIGREGESLPDLLDPELTVSFDLDGDGRDEDWPWVRPDAGILVWDPFDHRKITSGRQLFGSVTFFLFHRDGYEALRLLDDNHDGRLTGLELDGLAIWHDENRDGRSSLAEVEPVWRAGITAIETYGARHDLSILHHLAGVRYEDGSVAPTFDWVTRPR